jgi:hypothetical protein
VVLIPQEIGISHEKAKDKSELTNNYNNLFFAEKVQYYGIDIAQEVVSSS